jgi:glycosyltransferase involved in cell wall biosynthesis
MQQHKLTIHNKIIIMVPYCDIYEPFIIKCLNSIYTQEYYNYNVIIVNDGSKNTKKINDFIKNKPKYILINCEENNGPAFTKWTFIKYLKSNIHKNNYNNNDIACIIDGDDYLLVSDALSIINETYNTNKCWFTYGNATGNFCKDNNKPIPNEWKNIREEKWIYNHPRSFKLFLIHRFTESDFKFNDKWLTKGTDRPLVYNCIELSGFSRVKSIEKILYNYVEHDFNSYKTIEPKYKAKQIEYLTKLKPKNKIIEDIHIVICYWKRIENLEHQLKNLNEQTVSKRIVLHLINNNPDYFVFLSKKINEFSKIFENIRIYLSHYSNEYYGFQRFFYMRDIILKEFIADYVIIMDDDQIFDLDWVEKIYNLKKPKTYFSWYTKKWEKNNLDYWGGSIIKINKNSNDIISPDINFHYGGTGGSIIDINIFNSNSKLWDVPTNTLYYTPYNIEDLWLSFVIIYYYGWEIKCSNLPEKKTLNYNGSNSKNQALYGNLIKEKQLFLQYLTYNYDTFIC